MSVLLILRFSVHEHWGVRSALSVWKSNKNFYWAVHKRRNSVWSILLLSTGEIKTHSSDSKPPGRRPTLRQLPGLCSHTSSLGSKWSSNLNAVPTRLLTWGGFSPIPSGYSFGILPVSSCGTEQSDRMMDTGQAVKCHLKRPPNRRDSQPPANRSSSAPRLSSGAFLATTFPFFWVPGFSLSFAPHLLLSLENLEELEVGAGKVYPRDVSFLFKGQRILKSNLLLNSFFSPCLWT